MPECTSSWEGNSCQAFVRTVPHSCETTVGCRATYSNCYHTLHQSIIIARPLPPSPWVWPLCHHPHYVIANDIKDQDYRSWRTLPLEPDSSVSIVTRLHCRRPKNLGLIPDRGVGFIFFTQPRTALRFPQPPVPWIPGALPPGVL
jgi:hypothetical protein